MSWWAKATGAAMVAALIVSGCTSADQKSAQGDTSLWVAKDSSSTGEAMLEGTLRYLQDEGCWVVEPLAGDLDADVSPVSARTAVIWPPGSFSVEGSRHTVSAEGGQVMDGQHVQASAAFIHDPGEFTIPETCRTAGIAVVSNVHPAE